MGMRPMRDLGNNVTTKYASVSQNSGAPSLITAAGTGDNTKVTGDTIDRFGSDNDVAQTCVMAITYLAALTAAKTLSFAVEYQVSSDNSSWDTAVVLQAATVAATGAGNKTGVVEFNMDLSGLKRYIRFNITPDLSHTSTDTAAYAATCTLGGWSVLGK